jgi:hypothetical protein
MKNWSKKPLPLNKVQLATAFSEPVYERLRLEEGDHVTHLLAFVRPPPMRVEEMLTRVQAFPHSRFSAECYAAVWELAPEWATKPTVAFLELDQAISSQLGTFEGRCPATAGYWFAGSPSKDSPRRVSSRLLEMSQLKGQSPAR